MWETPTLESQGTTCHPLKILQCWHDPSPNHNCIFNGSLVSLQGYGKTQQPARSKEAKLVQTRVVTTGDDELGTLATDDKKDSDNQEAEYETKPST